jgi:hypothetical protein
MKMMKFATTAVFEARMEDGELMMEKSKNHG